MYSVINAGDELHFGPIGLSEDSENGPDVYTIVYKDIACVVSESPIKEWDISRKNMMKHQEVNELVMHDFVTLPIKFCTIAEDKEQIIEKFLKSRYDEFRERLDYFSDKGEYGVKALWIQMEKVFAEIMEENPKLKEWRERLEKLLFDKARNDMIILGQKVKEALGKKKESFESELFEYLKPFAVEAKTNDLMGDRMALNGAFLISQATQKNFDDQINKMSEEYRDNMQFKYVGPTPPANFIEIVVDW